MRRRDKLKNIERANLLAEQRHLESKGVLTEGIIDKVKDKLIGPINDLIDKLGDKGQEVYNKLVDSFGENPSMDTIKAKVQSELNEDRDFNKLGLMADPKYADKEGKQNTTDKIMGVLTQIIGLNASMLGVPLSAAITVMLGLPAIGGFSIGAVISLIIFLFFSGFAGRYGHARDKQLDEATNLLAEQRHLESKGVLSEALTTDLEQFAEQTLKPKLEGAGFQVALFGADKLKMVVDKVDENPKLIGIIWNPSNLKPYGSKNSISIHMNGEATSKVNSILSKFSFAKESGEAKQGKGWDSDTTHKALATYNEGDLVLIDGNNVRTKVIFQAGNPEELGLREVVVNKNASDGVDYISVNIKKDDDTSREVKGRVEPTDIGFIIYNEEYDNRPYNIVWDTKRNKFINGETVWYNVEDVVPTSGYEDAFNKLEASYGKTDLKEGQMYGDIEWESVGRGRDDMGYEHVVGTDNKGKFYEASAIINMRDEIETVRDIEEMSEDDYNELA